MKPFIYIAKSNPDPIIYSTFAIVTFTDNHNLTRSVAIGESAISTVSYAPKDVFEYMEPIVLYDVNESLVSNASAFCLCVRNREKGELVKHISGA